VRESGSASASWPFLLFLMDPRARPCNCVSRATRKPDEQGLLPECCCIPCCSALRRSHCFRYLWMLSVSFMAGGEASAFPPRCCRATAPGELPAAFRPAEHRPYLTNSLWLRP